MYANKKNAIAKIVAYILAISVFVCMIGIIAKFTDGFTQDFQTFYLSVDGIDITSYAKGYSLDKTDLMKVDVRYAFNFPTNEAKSYSVKIIPNAVDGKDFNFTLDDIPYSFQAEKDLTQGFDIMEEETFFTIAPKGNITDILQAVYPTSEIEDCVGNGYEDMFALIVTSYNGEESVTLYFTVFDEISDIFLNEEEIMF